MFMKNKYLIAIISFLTVVGVVWGIHAITINLTPAELKELTSDSLTLGSGGELIDTTSINVVSGGTSATYITDATHDFAVGGTTNAASLWFDESAGDLFVDGDFDADGYATTTSGLFTNGNGHIGGTFSADKAVTLNSTLSVTGNATFGAIASTTDYFIIGNSLGNDDDNLYFDIGLNEYFGWDDSDTEFDVTDDLNITGNASTSLDMVVGSESNNATTTLQIKTDGSPGSCIEMIDVGTGAQVRVYINSATMKIEAGTCK